MKPLFHPENLVTIFILSTIQCAHVITIFPSPIIVPVPDEIGLVSTHDNTLTTESFTFS